MMPSLIRLAVVAKLCAIAGSAVTMIVPSRFCMNCAQATMSAICIEGRATAALSSRREGIPVFYRDPRLSMPIGLGFPADLRRDTVRQLTQERAHGGGLSLCRGRGGRREVRRVMQHDVGLRALKQSPIGIEHDFAGLRLESQD